MAGSKFLAESSGGRVVNFSSRKRRKHELETKTDKSIHGIVSFNVQSWKKDLIQTFSSSLSRVAREFDKRGEAMKLTNWR